MSLRLHHTRTVLVALAIVPWAAACGSTHAGSSVGGSSDGDLGSLVGRSFVSTDITDGAQRALDAGTTVTLRFGADGVVSGSAGCNTLSAQATLLDGHLLTDGPVGGTEMGCPGRQHHDEWLSQLLGADPQVMLDGDRLTLTSGGTIVQMQDTQSASPDEPLIGPVWTLHAIEDGTGRDATISSVPAGVTSTLRFRDDGTLAARLGCNGGGADFTATDAGLVVQPIMHTQMACAEPAMEVESTVLEVMNGAVAFAIEGYQLRLTRNDRTLIYRSQDRPVG